MNGEAGKQLYILNYDSFTTARMSYNNQTVSLRQTKANQ